MSKAIYIHQQHKNFQIPASKLKRSSVYRSHLFLIMSCVFLAICLFALAIYQIASVTDLDEANVGRTMSRIIDCQTQSGSAEVSYRYMLRGESYTLVYLHRGRDCSGFQRGESQAIYYQKSNPENAQLVPFEAETIRNQGMIIGGIALVVTGYSSFLIFKELRGHRKYQRLQNEGIVVEASVTSVINKWKEIVKQSRYETKHEKQRLMQATYRFFSPAGEQFEGRIRSDIHNPWPKDIHEGDTLHILYLDNETYCVL